MFDPDTYYRFSNFVRHYVATAGVMYTCEEQQCYWVLDCIASYTPILKNKDYLQIVTVDVTGSSAVLKITDEINGLLVEQDIPFTDLQTSLKWWIIQQGDLWVVLLPEEY